MGSWEAAVANARGKKVGNGHNVHGYIAQWLERLTADQQVPGSNPGVPFSNNYSFFSCAWVGSSNTTLESIVGLFIPLTAGVSRAGART